MKGIIWGTRAEEWRAIAGNDVTEYLSKLLSQNGVFSCTSSAGLEVVNDIKEKLGQVAMDKKQYKHIFDEYDYNQRIWEERDYELPDGVVLNVGQERFQSVGLMFHAGLIGQDWAEGIHRCLDYSINKCDIDIRKELYGNIVLSGGNTLFDGICVRLQQEMKSLAPDGMDVNIVAAPERKYSAWIGGSILASLSGFEEMWISREEYEEEGPRVVIRKCLNGSESGDGWGPYAWKFWLGS